MSKLIAIIDDERDIIELVKYHLEENHYQTVSFFNGESFFEYMENSKIDFIILDIMLPDTNGTEICKRIRGDEKYKEIPILMLTAKNSEVDRIVGLEMGADDYLTKPFSVRELVARVNAVLRRSDKKKEEKGSKVVKLGSNVIVYPEKFEVHVHKKNIGLTKTEFKLLVLMAKQIGWVLSREELLEGLWGNKYVSDRTIDVHIKNLRRKMGVEGKIIKNIAGVGYKVEV